MNVRTVLGYVALTIGWLTGILFVFALMVSGVPATGGDAAAAAGLGVTGAGGIVVGRLLVDAGRAQAAERKRNK